MAAKKGITQHCDKCDQEIGTYAFKRHYRCCNGIVKDKINKYNCDIIDNKAKCPYCDKLFSFKGIHIHIRCVHLNLPNPHFGKDGENQFTKYPNWIVSAETREKFSKSSTGRKYRPRTEEEKQHLSKIACARGEIHCRRSIHTEYLPGIILESSYEVRTAVILDKLNIKWIKVRKGYIWDDNGKTRRYIPDFYLEEYDLFLDPKNVYLIKKDKRKIDSAMELNNIKVIILADNEINEEYFKKLFNK